jgi:hypothetical protein
VRECIWTDSNKERDQIWAEARVRYELAEHWWLEDLEVIVAAKEELDARFQVDPWDKLVWDYTETARIAWRDKDDVSMPEAIIIYQSELPAPCKSLLRCWSRAKLVRRA